MSAAAPGTGGGQRKPDVGSSPRRRRSPGVRRTAAADIPALLALSRRIYPDFPWTDRELRSHLTVFPEGQLVAVDGGEVMGMASSLIVTWDDYDFDENWRDYTDDGMFTNHDPSGRTLYGAEIMVDPRCRRRGIGTALYDAREELVRRLGLERIRAHARLAGYDRVAGDMSARQYVEAVIEEQIADPTLSFQLARGFEVLGVVSDYLPGDPRSRGWAALIEWRNEPEDR